MKIMTNISTFTATFNEDRCRWRLRTVFLFGVERDKFSSYNWMSTHFFKSWSCIKFEWAPLFHVSYIVYPYVIYHRPILRVSGYSGFVPFKRGVNGLRYAKATKEGLRRFKKCVKEERDTICLPPGPATMKCSSEFVHPNRKIYLEDEGFMNSYTGHLPGRRRR